MFVQIPYIWPFPQSLLLSQIFSLGVQDEFLSAVVQMDIKHEYWTTSRKCCSQAIWKERLLEELIRGYNLFVIARRVDKVTLLLRGLVGSISSAQTTKYVRSSFSQWVKLQVAYIGRCAAKR